MESFLVAVNAVIPFFCYLALGYTMKIRGVVKEEYLQKLFLIAPYSIYS